MSVPRPPHDVAEIVAQLPPASQASTDGIDIKESDGYSEKIVDAIEMIGEERAAGLGPTGPSQVTPGMRYLHSSRTIHQLVTDRNRAVGIYLAVASLLLTASAGTLNAHPKGDMIIPIETIQRWCLPLTFATLAGLSLFVAFLLIRTRVGLIYEVAKMNALLGLPLGRVSRFSPLSIFFIMYAMVALAGGAAAALFAVFMFALADTRDERLALHGSLIGCGVTFSLLLLYLVTVAWITSDRRLQRLS